MKRIAPVAALLLASPALALASTWNLDPAHTHAAFTVRHLVISNVRGEFGKVAGTIALDEGDIARSKVEATIDVASIDTRQPKRDDDLRSPNFFDVAKFPSITFKSTRVEKAGDGRLKVMGDLTIHGVTRAVTLDVAATPEIKDPWGNTRRGFSAATRISRKDFGMTWAKAIDAGPVVGDEVAIEIEAEAVKAK
jgi:polyisoprenoid-binding protein YceI